MANTAVRGAYFDEEHWSIYTYGTVGVGGANSMELPWDLIRQYSAAYGQELIIDGVAISVTIAAGGVWRVIMNIQSTVPNIYMYSVMPLGSGAAAATVTTVASYFPLNLMSNPMRTGNFAQIIAVFAQNDVAQISAWGRYVQPKGLAEPQEVTVKGVEFFKKAPPRGPV